MKVFLVASLALLLLTPNVRAEGAATGTPATSEPYERGVGDIMNLLQERHIKLWFAGRSGNWPLADYEIDKLKDGFEDIDKLIGGDTVDKAVGAAIAALEKAVDAKDREAFTRGFDQLSAGCNSCHRTLDHAFIVIGRPTSLPFSDQFFAPQK
jgi:hypothetical protein